MWLLSKVEVKLLSHVRLFATLWTVAQQAPLSMGFSRQEYWNGLPFPNQNYNEVSLHTNQNGHDQKNLQTINTGEGVEKREPSYTVGGSVNWYSHCGEQYGGSFKN